MLKITIPHEAQPGGSKTVTVNYGLARKLGRMIGGDLWIRVGERGKPGDLLKCVFVRDSGKHNKAWKKTVEKCAIEQLRIPENEDDRVLLDMPLIVATEFHLPRPKDHYKKNGDFTRKGRLARAHTKKPDALKLMRSTEDALTGVIWRDDAQVIDHFVHKRYASRPEDVRTVINVFPANAYEYELNFRKQTFGELIPS